MINASFQDFSERVRRCSRMAGEGRRTDEVYLGCSAAIETQWVEIAVIPIQADCMEE